MPTSRPDGWSRCSEGRSDLWPLTFLCRVLRRALGLVSVHHLGGAAKGAEVDTHVVGKAGAFQ